MATAAVDMRTASTKAIEQIGADLQVEGYAAEAG